MTSLAILYVGDSAEISTSRLRSEAMQAIGASVEPVDSQGPAPWRIFFARAVNRVMRYPSQHRSVANALLKRASVVRPDLVWCDKGVYLTRDVLRELRGISNPLLIHYNPDDPFGHSPGFWSTFVRAIPEYDVHFVPKRENVREYRDRGADQVLLFDRGFCRRSHKPPSRSHPRWGEFAAPVSFIGTYEQERAGSIGRLIRSGVPVTIRGGLWSRAATWSLLEPHFKGTAVAGDAYALAVGAPQITLHFLRHANRDEQDSRTFEIPACGGFMVAEWSPRHAELFEEDREAVFFRSDDELVAKVKYYLDRPDECAAIAARGRARALASGYDYESRMHELLTKAIKAAARDDLLPKLPPRELVAS